MKELRKKENEDFREHFGSLVQTEELRFNLKEKINMHKNNTLDKVLGNKTHRRSVCEHIKLPKLQRNSS